MQSHVEKPPAMVSPSLFVKWGGSISGGIALFATIVGLAKDNWSDAWNFLFPGNRILNPLTFSLSLAFVSFFTFIILYVRLYAERNKRRDDITRIQNLRLHLDDIERERLLDLRTGVPSERKLTHDFDSFKRDELTDQQVQMIMIDLDDFGSINTKFGHQKGNEIIRLVAQDLYRGVRRDEEIYTPRDAEIYRRFAGGDEFVFLIRGMQYEAVGFVTRLRDKLRKLSDSTEAILGSRFEIDIHGAISPIYQKDTYEEAVERLEKCFVEAKADHSTSRVYWWTREEKKYADGDFRRTIYDRAVAQFNMTPNTMKSLPKDPKSRQKRH